MVGFRGTRVSRTSPVGKAILAGELGGVILYDGNITSPTQLATLTSGLAGFSRTPLLVAVDQEGGKVARLGPSHGFRSVPSQASVGARGDVGFASDLYDNVAKTLSSAGINLNLAPVLDVNVNPKNPAVGALDRSFSADPNVVTEMALVAIEAHHRHGVLTALKHFPGLGSASANTDVTTVDVSKTWLEDELIPFRAVIAAGDADLVMVGHFLNSQLDKRYPASLSRATLATLLRVDLGWAGPVISDDMQAAAITKKYDRPRAIALAINAGVDLLIFSSPPSDASDLASDLVDEVAKLVKVGTIDEGRIDEAVARVELLRERL